MTFVVRNEFAGRRRDSCPGRPHANPPAAGRSSLAGHKHELQRS
jgi:hypothetical protein